MAPATGGNMWPLDLSVPASALVRNARNASSSVTPTCPPPSRCIISNITQRFLGHVGVIWANKCAAEQVLLYWSRQNRFSYSSTEKPAEPRPPHSPQWEVGDGAVPAVILGGALASRHQSSLSSGKGFRKEPLPIKEEPRACARVCVTSSLLCSSSSLSYSTVRFSACFFIARTSLSDVCRAVKHRYRKVAQHLSSY